MVLMLDELEVGSWIRRMEENLELKTEVESWQLKARSIQTGGKLKTTCVYFTCSLDTSALPGRVMSATCESDAEGDLKLLPTYNPAEVG